MPRSNFDWPRDRRYCPHSGQYSAEAARENSRKKSKKVPRRIGACSSFHFASLHAPSGARASQAYDIGNACDTARQAAETRADGGERRPTGRRGPGRRGKRRRRNALPYPAVPPPATPFTINENAVHTHPTPPLHSTCAPHARRLGRPTPVLREETHPVGVPDPTY